MLLGPHFGFKLPGMLSAIRRASSLGQARGNAALGLHEVPQHIQQRSDNASP